MKKNGEVTKFADYAKERIWRKNLDKFALSKSFLFPRAFTFKLLITDIKLPNEEVKKYRFGPSVVVHDVVKVWAQLPVYRRRDRFLGKKTEIVKNRLLEKQADRQIVSRF